MTEHQPALRRIAWQEVFPWFLIFRCWGLAVSGPIWLVATVGVLLGPIGFWLGGYLFLSAEAHEARRQQAELVRLVENLSGPYALPQSFSELLLPATSGGGVVVQRFLEGWQYLIAPPGGWNEAAHVVFGGLWMLVIWGFAAGIITRAAVMRLGCDRHTTIPVNFQFVLTRWRSYFAAPLLPLAPLLLGCMALAFLGWIGGSGIGLLLVGLLWPLVLVMGCILTILLVGVALGWPFMWVALGAETDADAFEAVSRGYTYALQRPLRLIGYVSVAVLVGLVGWIVVYHLSEILIAFISGRLPPRVFVAVEEAEPVGLMFRWGAGLIHLGNGLVRSVAQAYGYSFFFCAAAAAYLLLRKDIDEAPIDQIHDDQDDDQSLQLPPLPDDLRSVTSAGMADTSASSENAHSENAHSEIAHSESALSESTPSSQSESETSQLEPPEPETPGENRESAPGERAPSGEAPQEHTSPSGNDDRGDGPESSEKERNR